MTANASSNASANAPNTVRIESLATWDHFFHPTTGIFRLPNAEGSTIEHLDIDLRLVNESPFGTRDVQNEIYLPNVCRLTLRGGEFCQDDDKRVDCLVEVLAAVNPVEVRWLHAKSNVDDTFSLSTHMVHQGIIRAGHDWINLRKLTVQGGYPCPNLTAPTPFAVTPAHTPLPSPGLHMRSFSSLQTMAAAHAEKHHHTSSALGTIPTIPSYRSKHTDPAKVHERADRKRLADYALKPRFEYAFGSWAPEELRWSMYGRYTPAAITTIITNLLKAFSSTFPSSSLKDDRDLPSLIAFKPIQLGIIPTLQALPDELHLEEDVIAYLQDVTFISIPSTSAEVNGVPKYARLFDTEFELSDRERLGRRMKADFHLAGNNGSEVEIVPLDSLAGITAPTPLGRADQQQDQDHLSASPSATNANVEMTSPAHSWASLETTETGPCTSDADADPEALTPELLGSLVLEPGIRMGNKSRSGSLDTPVEGAKPPLNTNGLPLSVGVGVDSAPAAH